MFWFAGDFYSYEILVTFIATKLREVREGRVARSDYLEKNGELTQTWRSTHSSQNFQLEVKYCLDGHFEKEKRFAT